VRRFALLSKFWQLTGIVHLVVSVLAVVSPQPPACATTRNLLALTFSPGLPFQSREIQPPASSNGSFIRFGQQAIANGSEVPWSESPLVIDLSGLRTLAPSRSRVRYRLMGVESDWVETAEQDVRYPNMAPGAYRFQAAVVDAPGGPAPPLDTDSTPTLTLPITEVSFVIAPRWWQSGPLRLGLMLLATLGVVLGWRWSIHLLVLQKRHLEQAVKLRTEDLEREKAELLRTREQMRHYAEHDDLTGLWNHRIIIERLRQEVDRASREGSPIALILVDLDYFKRVNDTFGHMAGDLVLREIGAIFQRSVRSYDWVGRYGGEEFLLILPGSGFAGARVRAEQLRLAVQWAQIHDGEQSIPVTASFGVACGIPTGYEMLIQSADAALYRAKDNGRNCVVATEVDAAPKSKRAEG